MCKISCIVQILSVQVNTDFPFSFNLSRFHCKLKKFREKDNKINKKNRILQCSQDCDIEFLMSFDCYFLLLIQ